jgi:hypothetical protein
MPALKIEPPEPIEPDVAPATTELAGQKPEAAPAKPAPDSKKKLDTAGIDQFLKAQIGDRYESVSGKKKAEGEGESAETDAEDKTPPRGEDGKFKKAEEAKAAAKAKAKEKEPEKPVAKPKPPSKDQFKPKPQPQTEPLTAEQITAAAAEGVTKVMLEASNKTKAEAEKPKEPTLPPQDQRKVEILNRMEELFPDKYKGIAGKYTKSLSALEAFAKKWEADHPGQEFDEESPEHEDFFKENDVDWNDLDFTEALADLRADKRMKEATSKTDERLEALDRAEKLRGKQGEIVAEQNSAAVHYWQQLGDDVADMVKPDGTLNMAKVDTLRTTDPEGLSLRVTAAQALDAEVAEIYKLYTGLVKNDPDNNAIHRNINQFAATRERMLESKPTQEKLNAEGQSFLPAAKYYRLPVAERAHHWTFNASDLAFMRAADLADITRKRLELNEERHRAWAKAKGIQLEDPNAKPESPSAGGESRMAALEGPAPNNVPSGHIDFLRKQLGH